MNTHELDIRLIKIEEDSESTHLYRWELMRYENTPVDVSLTSDFIYRANKNVVTVKLSTRYTTLRGQMTRRLLDYSILATFEAAGADSVADTEELIVDTEVVKMMLSIALGALRGMLALRTANTFLAHYPLPIYDMRSLIEPVMKSAEAISV